MRALRRAELISPEEGHSWLSSLPVVTFRACWSKRFRRPVQRNPDEPGNEPGRVLRWRERPGGFLVPAEHR